MQKNTIISALKKIEAIHCAEMFHSSISHIAEYVSNHLQQNDELNAFTKPVDAKPDSRKRRKTNPPYVCANSLPLSLQTRYKGLRNPGNRCYFNAVIQCLLYCPLARQSIETLPERAFSIHVLRELRILFNRMCNNDALTYVSPVDCFKAAINTPECNLCGWG